jgi:hypothetical protein
VTFPETGKIDFSVLKEGSGIPSTACLIHGMSRGKM